MFSIICLKRAQVLMVCGCLHFSAHAADPLPANLTGTWATGKSLYDGSDKQTEMYLLADGFGLLAGSTTPAQRADGSDDGKPGPRAIIGFPVRANVTSDGLLVKPFLPNGVQSAKLEKASFPCLYSVTSQTLTCNAPTGETFTMRRRSETVPEDALRTIAEIKGSID